MLKIGEFSKLSHLTIKALRFYEKEGLLKPASVDEWNNYRFMKPHNLKLLQRSNHTGSSACPLKK